MSILYYDLIIIGSGPAGLIAAIESNCPAHKIIILEKMPRPAIKLRISGKGRCNITNRAEFDEFISHFGHNGKFLKFALHEFFNEDLIRYFEEMGIKFKLERGGRYFPESNKAIEIVNVLLKKLQLLNIPLKTNNEVSEISKDPEGNFQIFTNITNDIGRKIKGKQYKSKRVLLATGGKSYPKTGSTGQGYKLAGKLGHSITPVYPALVPLISDNAYVRALQGLTLKNVMVNVWHNKKRVENRFGEMIFTESGISGPIILSLSKTIVKLIQAEQDIKITIDLKPALDLHVLDRRLLREINSNGRQKFDALLKKLLPHKMIPVFLNILNVSRNLNLSELSSDIRKRLRSLLKEFPVDICGYGSYDEAIITAGGVKIEEINSKTMESKLVKGLFFAGEVIDIDADTGGYNLQAAFSTGWVAGRAISKSFSQDNKADGSEGSKN